MIGKNYKIGSLCFANVLLTLLLFGAGNTVIGKTFHSAKSVALNKLAGIAADTCSPISTLNCNAVKVGLPYSLNFNAAIPGTINDKTGQGTGFTTVNTYSGTRLSVDGTRTYSTVPGYEPSKITLTGGRLQVVANKGIDYLTNNNQINVLGVQVAPVKKLQIDAKIISPYNGTQSQQVGIWFGLNDKTFIKLTIAGNKVEMRKELNDVSSTTSGTANPDQRVTPVISGLSSQIVSLRIVIDSANNTVEGFYSTDSSTFVNVGASYPSPSISVADMAITNTDAYAAIYASYRNGTAAVTYTFDDFAVSSITVPVVPPTQNVNINFQTSSTNTPAGYLADTGLPYDATRKFGWINPNTKQPVDLQANMRLRTGTGDIKQLSLVQMQATTSPQVPGNWEYAVTNGTYRVTISAGDFSYFDSNNQINIEGLPTIADFSQTSGTKFKTATAVVQVSDGKLTVDANGGVNSKLNYITFAPVTAVADNIAPTATARFVGTLKSTSAYDDEVQVFLSAADAGGAGLASLQYSLNSGAFVDYKIPFILGTAGSYTLAVKATDANGNTTTNSYSFSIIAQSNSGAYLSVKNLDAFPSNDRLVFSLIQTPWRRTSPDTTPYNANHDRVKLRVNNKGTGKLKVNNLVLSNPAVWKIVSVNTDTLSTVPFSVTAGSFVDVTIQFRAKDAATRLKVFNDTLTIASTDSISPAKKVVLAGIWQKEGESTNEPYAQQLINAFGFGTIVGYGHDDGNIDGTTRVSSSSEINADYFVRADASKPVTIVQIAAYHGCCSATESIKYFNKGSTSNLNIFTHNPLDGQSIMPRLIGSTTNLARGTFSPTTEFGFRVGTSSTDRTQNFNGLIGIRVLKALDAAGNIIPNAYFLNGDYLGTSYTNYDYQDNIYYIENIRPDSGTVNYSQLISLPNTSFTFEPTVTGNSKTIAVTLKNNGNSYADSTSDPSIQIKSVKITGPNASEFSTPTFATTTVGVQGIKAINVKFSPETVGIKNAWLVVNYNSALAPLRIPLYGIGNTATSTVNVVKRIKGGSDANVTIGNVAWESDKNYRKGSIKLDMQVAASPIAGTDIDSLYQTYLSAATDLAETRYEIPVTNGDYLVRMHFVENYWTEAGLRVFGINIENQLVLPNYDIFSEAAYRTATVKDFSATVTDGVLTVKFNPTANRVALAALELYQVTNTTPPTVMVADRNSLLLNKPDSAATAKKMVVYPNPNLGSQFNLNISNFPKTQPGTITITDMFGKTVQKQKYITDEYGTAYLQIQFSRVLTKGVYMINVRSGSVAMYAKLLVQ
ncbi:malectin domain-containing carbohydrate-binding protein [Mucilaginibacter psychrotolerans]|uniref:T9SS type A sorting domain-containing protein n=1 Tax=Mucilaginibacter psychrotolerans TaxID=1524096 RepID=A0A4Y8SMU9_9SPHI|nr:malectin domain-containing carbohydrate-binding protein [Mucilaginibacter psychrotolerans]TFF39837.1 T9SS type A sorting domain-containing protein [Mucilaginibacter psychrotolerans]